MEPPSVPAHRGCVPWQGLLLTAALLPFWSLPATAITVELVPPNVVEGEDVVMLIHKLPENILRLDWYKTSMIPNNTIFSMKKNPEKITPGPLFSNRETLYSNGTLLFRTLAVVDKGHYYVQVITQESNLLYDSAQLGVYVLLPKPNITASHNTTLMEKVDTMVLTCVPKTRDTVYRWFFNAKPITNDTERKLSEENRVLTLNPVLRNHTGDYACETWNPVSINSSDHISLVVIYGPDTPIISPSNNFYRRGMNVSLSCYTASNPSANFTWLFSNIVQVTSPNYFIPAISQSRSYTCTAHNSVTGLSASKTIKITVLDPVSRPSIDSSNSMIEGYNFVSLFCLTNESGISVQWFLNNKIVRPSETHLMSTDNRTLTLKPVIMSHEGEYQCEVSNAISSLKSPPVMVYAIPKSPPGLSAGATAGIVIGVLAGICLTAGLLYFVFTKNTGGANDQRHLTENKLPSSNKSQDHSDNPLNKVEEVAYSFLDFNAQKQKKQIPATPHPTTSETIYAQVKE